MAPEEQTLLRRRQELATLALMSDGCEPVLSIPIDPFLTSQVQHTFASKGTSAFFNSQEKVSTKLKEVC
jgi:hypothetical protein